MVASHIGSIHHEIIITEDDFTAAIPEVIYDIESYDTTTVRASLGNWLLGKYIANHSQAKVILNGDGSDELAGGYLYMNYAPDAIEFDRECRRLLREIHLFDVLRSDKSISSHGLEPRTPFLDRTWVQFYLSLPMYLRQYKTDAQNPCPAMEKHLLRMAFSAENYTTQNENKPLLPDEVLWRRKEAFSDGVSKNTRSLYEILQEYAAKQLQVELGHDPIDYGKLCKQSLETYEVKGHLVPQTAEQFYYRKVFEMAYPGRGDILPYFWMPKYVEAKDASARTLAIYHETI
jgi:asparagine synthase (glutamine-hydrolysing)